MARSPRPPVEPSDLPTSMLERAELLMNVMVAAVTSGEKDEPIYKALRADFIHDPAVSERLPAFVRTCRTLTQFWGWIGPKTHTWAERRALIGEAFVPMFAHLEAPSLPVDEHASEVLRSFDEQGVHAVWTKAMQRRMTDPEGAITVARTLLETVCKQILDRAGVEYRDRDDLPQLYGKVAAVLSLAPSQHTEEAFKTILGSVQNMVNTLATIRNRIGDAHGQGGRPVKPSPRHAALAVSLAGATAVFLVETELASGRANAVRGDGSSGD